MTLSHPHCFISTLTPRSSRYFTVPVLVSETLRATNLTGFGDLLTQTNLSSSIDARSSITIFAPSNAAFAARNASSQTSTGPLSLASAHVIPNFVGYLPVLQDGATHRTLAGDVVTVRMVNGSYFINDARIIETNIITDNGVIHVIDEVSCLLLANASILDADHALGTDTGHCLLNFRC